MTETLLLRFSFFEHDWDGDVDWAAEAEAELLRRAEGDWFPVDGTDEPEEFETLDELAERAEEVVVGEWDMPADAVRLPLAKLRAIIAEGGWTFAAGDFADYEGHHNDTELTVKLVRDV
ncbi:hypothetical protein QEZ54_16345 [Catellatospora sp. KI3]|uniref:hypothetical protein n=1 Tax=Catellatospora sp. KI3 TaxID=3041620 RepID=UPI0024826A55|nr:hypothetical protein [Catellatospora sp. KI3]MDI1462543.1 hypothetical protein [Catellatospora sp. KI3]